MQWKLMVTYKAYSKHHHLVDVSPEKELHEESKKKRERESRQISLFNHVFFTIGYKIKMIKALGIMALNDMHQPSHIADF